jgi:2Fe-2S ferredoxin
MPIVTVLPGKAEIEVAAGTSLLDAILRTGTKFATKCGGKGECGECHVFVPEGKKTLSRAQREENAMLDTIVGVGSKSRMACQAKVGSEDVTVELLGFASG